jgi:hypothetical protein
MRCRGRVKMSGKDKKTSWGQKEDMEEMQTRGDLVRHAHIRTLHVNARQTPRVENVRSLSLHIWIHPAASLSFRTTGPRNASSTLRSLPPYNVLILPQDSRKQTRMASCMQPCDQVTSPSCNDKGHFMLALVLSKSNERVLYMVANSKSCQVYCYRPYFQIVSY